MFPGETRPASPPRTREDNRRLNLREFSERRATLSSLPRVLFIELTENCNLSCSMCRSNGPFDRSKNMSREIFERVAEELFPTAEIVDLRGWGESSILKDFEDFVDITLGYGCRIRLVTNLTVPKEAMWRRLVRENALIAVSYDAADPMTFAALRGGAKLAVVQRNLAAMADECERTGVPKSNVHLNVVVQQEMASEIPDIIRFADSLGFSVRLNPVTLDEGDSGELERHRTVVMDALAATHQVAEELDVDVFLNAAPISDLALPEKADKTCTHPWMYAYVNFRGQVGFCDHLIGSNATSYLLGDIVNASFADVWNNDAYRALRREHAAGALSEAYEECRWCYANRYMDFDDESNPDYAQYEVTLGDCPAITNWTPSEVQPGFRRSLPLMVASTDRAGGTA